MPTAAIREISFYLLLGHKLFLLHAHLEDCNGSTSNTKLLQCFEHFLHHLKPGLTLDLKENQIFTWGSA